MMMIMTVFLKYLEHFLLSFHEDVNVKYNRS